MSIIRSLLSVLKIRLRLHYSWIAVIIFMVASMITQFSTDYPFMERLILGLIGSGIFLLIIIIRMSILSFLAVRRGAVIKSNTIFAIGGVLEIDKTTIFPALELLIGVVGSLIYLIVAGVIFTIYKVMENTGSIMVHVLVQWLAFIFFMLALFNLIPGLPLDGGRMFLTLLWKAVKDYDKVTRIVSWMGWVFGIAFTIAGLVLTVTTQQWFVGFLLILPGLILQNAATHQRHLASDRNQLKMVVDSPPIG